MGDDKRNHTETLSRNNDCDIMDEQSNKSLQA